MLTNKNFTVLYTGVTADLYARMLEHRNTLYPNSFSARYKTKRLVYYELHNSIEAAIEREKHLKKLSRKGKESCIKTMNPLWEDLFDYLE